MAAKKRRKAKAKVVNPAKRKTRTRKTRTRKNPTQFQVKVTRKSRNTGKKWKEDEDYGLPIPSRGELATMKSFMSTIGKLMKDQTVNPKDVKLAIKVARASGNETLAQSLENKLEGGKLFDDRFQKAEIQGTLNLLKKYVRDFSKRGTKLEEAILNMRKAGHSMTSRHIPFIPQGSAGVNREFFERLDDYYKGKGTKMGKKRGKKKNPVLATNPVFASNPSLGEDGEQNPRRKKRRKAKKHVAKTHRRKSHRRKTRKSAFEKMLAKPKHRKHRRKHYPRKGNPGLANLPTILGANSTWMSLAMLGVAAGTAGTLNALANKFFLDGLMAKLPAAVQKPLAAIRPALIPAALGIGLWYLGKKNKMAKQLGEAYATTAVVALGINLIAPFIKKTLPMAGIPEGMGDVALLGIPEGMSGVELLGIPEGMSDDGEYGDADFGEEYEGIPEGMSGVELLGDADFGDADFGDADFGDADFGDDIEGIPEGMGEHGIG